MNKQNGRIFLDFQTFHSLSCGFLLTQQHSQNPIKPRIPFKQVALIDLNFHLTEPKKKTPTFSANGEQAKKPIKIPNKKRASNENLVRVQ